MHDIGGKNIPDLSDYLSFFLVDLELLFSVDIFGLQQMELYANSCMLEWSRPPAE